MTSKIKAEHYWKCANILGLIASFTTWTWKMNNCYILSTHIFSLFIFFFLFLFNKQIKSLHSAPFAEVSFDSGKVLKAITWAPRQRKMHLIRKVHLLLVNNVNLTLVQLVSNVGFYELITARFERFLNIKLPKWSISTLFWIELFDYKKFLSEKIIKSGKRSFDRLQDDDRLHRAQFWSLWLRFITSIIDSSI